MSETAIKPADDEDGESILPLQISSIGSHHAATCLPPEVSADEETRIDDER